MAGPIRLTEDDEGVRITLPGDLDLGMSANLVENLRHAAKSGKPVRVEADRVERVGTAPLQALMIASREAERRGSSFGIVAPSEVFAETCGDLGLDSWLEKWSRM